MKTLFTSIILLCVFNLVFCLQAGAQIGGGGFGGGACKCGVYRYGCGTNSACIYRCNDYCAKLHGVADPLPGETILYDIFPNPAVNTATIALSLGESHKISVKVFDLSGRLVTSLADETFEAGEMQITWNTSAVNAGVYFLLIQATDYSKMEKLIVVK